MAKPRKVTNVEVLGEIYEAMGNFYHSLESIRSIGIPYQISARDFAYVRCKAGVGSYVGPNLKLLVEKAEYLREPINIYENSDGSITNSSSWIKEGIVYLPPDNVVFVKDPPTLRNAKSAFLVHKNGMGYYINKEEADRIIDKLNSPNDNTVFNIRSKGAPVIPTDTFGSTDLICWLFEDQVKDYGLLLNEMGVSHMPIFIEMIDFRMSQRRPFATHLYLRPPACFSSITGFDRKLHLDSDRDWTSRTYGVLKKTTNNFLPQIQTQSF